jgi:hypothetical protein
MTTRWADDSDDECDNTGDVYYDSIFESGFMEEEQQDGLDNEKNEFDDDDNYDANDQDDTPPLDAWIDPVDADPLGGVRRLHAEDCVLSEYLSSSRDSKLHVHGMTTTDQYTIPLHVLSVVPGHTTKRIAVHRTRKTKRSCDVMVSFKLKGSKVNKGIGKAAFLDRLSVAHRSMADNPYAPREFELNVYDRFAVGEGYGDAPLSLGTETSIRELSLTTISTVHAGSTYTVPTTAPKFRFRKSVGLGSTLVNNTVVMMYPDVEQYMVSSEHRTPREQHVGFLCCTSSSSSAASKGLVRHTASEVECRTMNDNFNDCLHDLYMIVENLSCSCGTVDSNVYGDDTKTNFNSTMVYVMGCPIPMCYMCVQVIRSTYDKWKYRGSSSFTLGKGPIPGSITISFPVGAVMKRLSDGMWIDSAYYISENEINGVGYFCIVSPALSMIPAIAFINPTRASLTNIYLSQAVCMPACIYEGCTKSNK